MAKYQAHRPGRTAGLRQSTVAEGLSRALSLSIFSVDPIEAAMRLGGISQDPTGIAAYEVAAALADQHLRLGHSVIIDAVNPVEAPRAVWRKLALKHRASLTIIECECTNEVLHRQRVEARTRNITAMPELRWETVLVRRAEYEAWRTSA